MIDTMEKARKYFIDLDGSKFNMAREFPLSYKEYCSLNIPKEVEDTWRKEKFDEYYESYQNNTSLYEEWLLHLKLVEIAMSINNIDIYGQLVKVSVELITRVESKQLILIGENIADRNDISLKDNVLYRLLSIGMRTDAVKLKSIMLNRLLADSFEDAERAERLIKRYETMEDII